MDESTERKCECKMPQRYAAHPNCPVEFDDQMGEFHLVKNGNMWVMRYCSWCGGVLPESRRGSFFTKIEEHEREEVLNLIRGQKTLANVIATLGEPDERKEKACGGWVPGKGHELYPETLYYTTRWRSVRLLVHGRSDGLINYSISGHYIGPPVDHEPT